MMHVISQRLDFIFLFSHRSILNGPQFPLLFPLSGILSVQMVKKCSNMMKVTVPLMWSDSLCVLMVKQCSN